MKITFFPANADDNPMDMPKKAGNLFINKYGVKTKLMIWLCMVILPIAVACMVAIDIIDLRLTDRIEKDLMNARRLEAARITDALDDYRREGLSLAVGKHVKLFLSGLNRYQSNSLGKDETIGGIDGFAVIDAQSALPLQELAIALLKKSNSVGSDVLDISIRDRFGKVVGQTAGFSWQPYDVDIVEQSIKQSKTLFGNAFRVSEGDERLGLVAPVVHANKAVGALVIESRLGPIVDLVVAHEGFGETSESHIAQPTAEGDAEFITLMRFKRKAAFNKIVPKSKNLPINWSLESLGGQVVRSPDYRSVDSILAIETLADTGWGLVVKIDAEEAFEPVAEVKKIVAITVAIVGVLVLLGWFIFLRPLGSRLEKTAQAAESIAAGNLDDRIGDSLGDEIGDVSRSIDKLAHDLAADIELRRVAEEKLSFQATHDELTGLYNRKHGNQLIAELDQTTTFEHTSILFMDLDGFKGVNDTYGHSAGDQILISVSNRLKKLLNDDAVLVRWGGDEFVVILPDTDQSNAEQQVERIKALFNDPIATEYGEHAIGCSIGLSTSRGQSSLTDVLRDADTQMYVQKKLSHITEKTENPVSKAQSIVVSAFEEGRVEVWYQPIFSNTPIESANNRKGNIIGAEAAVRIRMPDATVLTPNLFLQDIAHLPLAAEVDNYVHRIALRTLAQWRSNKVVSDQFYLSLNVGNALMTSNQLYSNFLKELKYLNLNANNIEFRISNVVSDIDTASLNKARNIGVRIAISNMGTIHSNLDRLCDIKPDVVKIDHRWLESFQKNPQDSSGAILLKLVQLCRDLEFAVAIVDADQRKYIRLLNEFRVTQLQGRLLSPFQVADSFISEWGNAHSAELLQNDNKAA